MSPESGYDSSYPASRSESYDLILPQPPGSGHEAVYLLVPSCFQGG